MPRKNMLLFLSYPSRRQVSRGPIQELACDTQHGIVALRAFGAEERTARGMHAALDASGRAVLLFNRASRTLGVLVAEANALR